MNKKVLAVLMAISLLAGLVAISIVKLAHPKLAEFSSLITALFHQEPMTFVYLLALFVFVLISYIIILVGFMETFKKIKRSVKNHFRVAHDWNWDDDDLTYTEIIIFVAYTIITLVLLVVLTPPLSAVLILLLLLSGFKD